MDADEVKAHRAKQREVESAELEAFQPSLADRRLIHGIALFFLLIGVVVGLPLWWLTTSPEQFALPTERIEAAARNAITIGVDVVVLSLDQRISAEDAESLKQMLYFSAADAQHSLDAQHQSMLSSGTGGTDDGTRSYAGLPVRVDYRFYVSASAAPSVPSDIARHLAHGISDELDSALIKSDLFENLGSAKKSTAKHSLENAYYFIILPADSRGFEMRNEGNDGMELDNDNNKLAAVVRARQDRNLIYLRSPCAVDSKAAVCSATGASDQLTSVILPLLQEHLVMPSTLQAMYASVWWKGADADAAKQGGGRGRSINDYAVAQAEVARQRTHQLPASPGYEVTVSLVGAFDTTPPCLPSTDNWMWSGTVESGLSLGEWLRRSVEPRLVDLRRRLSKDRSHRYYTTSQLSNVLNSLEAYLGRHASHRDMSSSTMEGRRTTSSHGGIHLVVIIDTPQREFNASARRPLRFRLSADSADTSIALVPQWGAFISLDDVNVSLANLGGVMINAIRSFLGFSVRNRESITVIAASSSGGRKILLENSSVNGEIIKWELDLWLRRRTIESLSTAALTLTSLLSTVKRVPTMVINSYVAGRVQHAVEAWMEAVGELASPPSTKSTNAGVKAFAAAQIALEDADAAFFDHSLLDLLYFPSDQVFGIYVPLFAPIGLPLLASGIAALKFFFKKNIQTVENE